MTSEKILQGNLFADCSKEELINLWHGLKDFYEKGRFEEDNPLTPYKNQYFPQNLTGVLQTEMDLLRAIAVRWIED